MDVPDGLPDGDRVGSPAVKAPPAAAPRPSDEELLDAIASLQLYQFVRLRYYLYLMLLRRIAKEAGL